MLITKEQQEAWISNYVKAGHSQDECIGFIDGVERVMAVISDEWEAQLKSERERAGKLMEALDKIGSINQSANHGWDLLRIREIAQTAINEYNNNQ